MKFNKTNIGKVSNNKPIMYTIKKKTDVVYVGTAKRSRGQERLLEQLKKIPGTEFSTRSFDTISNALKAEENKIKREKPKFNDQHNG